jgi:hypothetical protein
MYDTPAQIGIARSSVSTKLRFTVTKTTLGLNDSRNNDNWHQHRVSFWQGVVLTNKLGSKLLLKKTSSSFLKTT